MLLHLIRVLILIVLAAPAVVSAQTPAASRVTEVHAFVVDGDPIALSPDGTWIAGIGPDRESFCVWDTEHFTPTCDGERLTIVPHTITWAPDSSAVAFSEDTPRLFIDSDIHVFEMETGTLVNLTNDGDAELDIFSDSAQPVNVDLAPAWSPDSQHLVFARTVFGGDIEDPGTVLMTIPRAGGEPQEILMLAPPYPIEIFTTMAWQDEDAILFSIWKADESDGQNGVWRTSTDGGIEPVIPGTETDDILFPTIVDTSPNGAHLSVVALAHVYSGDIDEAFWLSDTDGSDPTLLTEAIDLPEDVTVVTAPGFSPDGSEIAFVTRSEDAFSLTVASLETGEATTVGTIDSPVSPLMELVAVDWADNGTIFVGTPHGGTLFTLES